MRSFPIEDDVVALVWERVSAKPFEDLSFSEALRKILVASTPAGSRHGPARSDRSESANASSTKRELVGINPASQAVALAIGRKMDARPQETARARAPKADLRRLVEWGLLCEGQELVFLDFKGHARKEHRAIISGNELKYGGMLFSMSGLASILLKEMGYIAESVRGPDHWATAEGQKVRAIWERALRKQRK